ncbi:MAG TPA: CocE/NonD family hydrolase [Amycolatopsis sp.]|nr:CocE/NonD family hydrolase [Amycolatopsis sp.]
MSFRVETDVMVPMRDGQLLATNLWIPDVRPAPTLLVRSPYGKDVLPGVFSHPLMPNIFTFLSAGYAVAWQDCRGTFGSEGAFSPHADDPDDGVDTIAWLRRQDWCDGQVAGYGGSYLGFVQWASAVQDQAGFAAIAPTVTSTDFYVTPWYSSGGAMSWHTMWIWATMMTGMAEQNALAAGAGDPNVLASVGEMMADPQRYLAAMPAADHPVLNEKAPWFPQFLRRPERDRFWQDLSVLDKPKRITVPALNIGGWFDLFVDNTVRTFTRMRAEAGNAEAREGQRLIVGPWDHLSADGVYHDRQFGLAADAIACDLTGAHVAFYDRWLRGRADALAGVAPVRIFVMGVDEWRDEEDWPLPDTRYTDYYLDSAGAAGTTDGDGVLRTAPPAEENADSYTYDPSDPVPSLGGRLMIPSATNAVGPVDQRPIEGRDDVLCFTTPVLDEPVEVTGHISLVLHIASSARDTDFTGVLVDVFPDGRSIYLTDGILRARYRDSLTEPELLDPERIYEVVLDLSVTSNVFLPGHRIRLLVSSSNFPRYDRNTNTGGVIAEESAEQAVIATNRVLHGPQHPSRLILPIIPGRRR